MEKKIKKIKQKDDGSTVAQMQSEELGVDLRNKKVRKAFKEIGFNGKETWAMIKGAYLAFLPAFLIMLAAFSLVWLILYLI